MPDESSLSGVFEAIDFLTRSQNRARILELLDDRECCRRRDCEEHLGISRTTVQRNLDALVEQGWVRENNDGYELNASGQRLYETFSEFADSVETIERLQPFLRWLPPDEFDLDISHLADAEMTVASSNNPYAPVNRHVDALQSADEFRICTSVIGRDAMEQSWRRVVDDGGEGEVVVTASALSSIQQDSTYSELFENIRGASALSVSVYDGEIPFYLGLIDDIVQIGVENAEQIPRALVESESQSVREWAERQYSQFRQQAESLE